MNYLSNKTYSKTGKKMRRLYGMKNDATKVRLSPKYNITNKIQKWLKLRQKLEKSKEPFKLQIGHKFYQEIEKINKRAPPVCSYNIRTFKNKKTSVNYNTLFKKKNTLKNLNQRKKRIQSCKIFCSKTEKNIKEKNKENFINFSNSKSCIKKCRKVISAYLSKKNFGYIEFDKFEGRKTKKKITYVDYDIVPNKINIKRNPKNIIFSNTRHKALKKNDFQNNYFNYKPKSNFSDIKNTPAFDLMTGRDTKNSFYKFTNLNPFYYNPKKQKKKIRTPLFDKFLV